VSVSRDQVVKLFVGLLKQQSRSTALYILGCACMVLGELEIASQLYAKANGGPTQGEGGQPP
jgi:hypothetical protein